MNLTVRVATPATRSSRPAVRRGLRFAGLLGLSRFSGLRGVLDHVVCGVGHPYGPIAALAGFAGDPQQLTGLDVSAPLPGTECDRDLAAVVADDDLSRGSPAFADVLDLIDPSFEGCALSGDQTPHRDHRRRPAGVLVGFDHPVFL